MITCISNPPFNLKWDPPVFAQMQKRFSETEIPPKSNANFAFILTALEEAEKSVFILPNGILNTNDLAEKKIREYLIKKNYVEAVILCPEKMFESTSIAVCILILNKNKNTTLIEMIDMRKECETEIREQKGQYGTECHTNRTYKKEIRTFNSEHMQKAIKAIKEHEDIKGYCKAVSIEDIKAFNYDVTPSKYIELKEKEIKTREYQDIIKDLNRVINEKNKLKIVMNEKVAKSLGIYQIFQQMKESEKINQEMIRNLEFINMKIKKEDYITISKNKNEIVIKNNDEESISEIILFALKHWTQHIHFLNNEENRYLIELRDKLLPDLILGKIDLKEFEK